MLGNKVMKMDEWEGNSVYYKIACSCCGGDECDAIIEFEIDNDFGVITVIFYKDIMWCDYWQNKWFFQKLWSRLKVACRVLLTGKTKINGDFIIQGQDHINSIIDAFNEGKEKMNKWKLNFEKEQKENKK